MYFYIAPIIKLLKMVILIGIPISYLILAMRSWMQTPVTESREYGNPIPSQNASLSNNYNITSAVHNCMCAFQFARSCYARTLRTADMLTLFCKLRKTKNF